MDNGSHDNASSVTVCTNFSIVNDAFTAANNRNYYVSLNRSSQGPVRSTRTK